MLCVMVLPYLCLPVGLLAASGQSGAGNQANLAHPRGVWFGGYKRSSTSCLALSLSSPCMQVLFACLGPNPLFSVAVTHLLYNRHTLQTLLITDLFTPQTFYLWV